MISACLAIVSFTQAVSPLEPHSWRNVQIVAGGFVIGRVGGVEGAFRSIDRGLTWVQINNEKSGFGTMMHICGDPKVFGRVYIGTNGRGIIVFDPIKKQGKGR
jgi:hypothetical protein